LPTRGIIVRIKRNKCCEVIQLAHRLPEAKHLTRRFHKKGSWQKITTSLRGFESMTQTFLGELMNFVTLTLTQITNLALNIN
jgi:hypothetical protein